MVETRASRWGASKDTGTRASSPRTPLPAPCVPQNQDAQPAQNSQSEGDVISRLIPFLITLQETQRQIFQLIIDQENHVPLPSSDDCPAQRVTLVNSKDLVTMKHSLGIQESLFSWSVRNWSHYQERDRLFLVRFCRAHASIPQRSELMAYPPGDKPRSSRSLTDKKDMRRSMYDASSPWWVRSPMLMPCALR